jgi:hypothetical protein
MYKVPPELPLEERIEAPRLALPLASLLSLSLHTHTHTHT